MRLPRRRLADRSMAWWSLLPLLHTMRLSEKLVITVYRSLRNSLSMRLPTRFRLSLNTQMPLESISAVDSSDASILPMLLRRKQWPWVRLAIQSWLIYFLLITRLLQRSFCSRAATFLWIFWPTTATTLLIPCRTRLFQSMLRGLLRTKSLRPLECTIMPRWS